MGEGRNIDGPARILWLSVKGFRDGSEEWSWSTGFGPGKQRPGLRGVHGRGTIDLVEVCEGMRILSGHGDRWLGVVTLEWHDAVRSVVPHVGSCGEVVLQLWN